MLQQLTLNVHLNDEATFDNFICPADTADSRTQAVAAIRQQYNNDEAYLYLWGSNGSGRSHLLQAACHAADQQQLSCQFLPLNDFIHAEPNDLLDSLDQVSLVCLDNIDSVLGQDNWEEALFHFFNRIKSSGNKLIISGNQAPQQLNVSLADLHSRLAWGPVFFLTPYSDEQKQILLQHRAKQCGLSLNDETAQFILQHYSRDMSELMAILKQLDESSLAHKRRLTIPFIKDVLA